MNFFQHLLRDLLGMLDLGAATLVRNYPLITSVTEVVKAFERSGRDQGRFSTFAKSSTPSDGRH